VHVPTEVWRVSRAGQCQLLRAAPEVRLSMQVANGIERVKRALPSLYQLAQARLPRALRHVAGDGRAVPPPSILLYG